MATSLPNATNQRYLFYNALQKTLLFLKWENDIHFHQWTVLIIHITLTIDHRLFIGLILLRKFE